MIDTPKTIESTGLDGPIGLTREQYERVAVEYLNSQRYKDLLGQAARLIVNSNTPPKTPQI